MERIHIFDNRAQIVDLALVFAAGTTRDPKGLEGLSYVASEMLLRGTAKYDRQGIREAIDFLGTSLSAEVGNLTLQVTGDSSTRNLDQLVELVRQILLEPTFPLDELEKVKRQTIAESSEVRDSDSACAGLFFTQLLFHEHPLGHPMRGYASSVKAITRDDIVSYRERNVIKKNLVMGTAGNVSDKEALHHLAPVLTAMPEGDDIEPLPAVPAGVEGLDVVLVARTGQTQAQIVIGQEGIPGSHPDLFPLLVSITGFGGTFTSVLVREIREKRGWSYGVSAGMIPGRDTGVFRIRYAPKTEDVVPSIELTLKLLSSLQSGGLEAEHMNFAREYLVNQYPFMVEAPYKRMNLIIRSRLTGKPLDYAEDFIRYVQGVTDEAAADAMGRWLVPKRQKIVVVGDPSLEKKLARLAGVSRVRVFDYSHDGPLES